MLKFISLQTFSSRRIAVNIMGWDVCVDFRGQETKFDDFDTQ